MGRHSRSTLFLIEQLIVVAVFAICSAACARILTYAFFTAKESKDVSNAILVAESAAESYKAVSGDIGKVAQMLGGSSGVIEGDATATVYYDKQWQVCAVDEADYCLRLMNGKPGSLSSSLFFSEILVEKLTGEELVAFTVAARRTGYGGYGT